jgi:hypothetical protein
MRYISVLQIASTPQVDVMEVTVMRDRDRGSSEFNKLLFSQPKVVNFEIE